MSIPLDDPSDHLSKIEIERVLRVARAARDEVITRKMQLQERELTHGNGHVREAILACANEEFLLTTAISKFWRQLHKT